MTITGIKENSGVYEGHIYDNIVIYAEYPLTSDKVKCVGNGNEKFSIKRSRAQNLLDFCAGDYSQLIGLEIDVLYDNYKKPSRIDLVGIDN